MSVYKRQLTSQYEMPGMDMTRKELEKGYKFYKEFFDKQNSQNNLKSVSLDVGFLFASPLVFNSESRYSG